MSLLEEELRAQPEVAERLLTARAADILAAIRNVPMDSVEWVLIAARGSSDNVARYSQAILGLRNQLTVALASPSLITLYGKPPSMARSLVIGISQSGASPDIVAVLKEARRQDRPTIAITNEGQSALARAVDVVIDLGLDHERSIAATGTYTASCAAAALMSIAIAGSTDDEQQLMQLPASMMRAVEDSFARAPQMERFARYDRCFVVGRGVNYGTAFEIALKVEELTGILAEPFSSADFLHGPIAAVEAHTPVVLVAPSGAAFDSVVGLLPTLHRRRAPVILITDDVGAPDHGDLLLPLPPGVPEWLSPLTAVIPGQVLAVELALARGLDPDAPRGLSKVTRTR